MSYCSGVGGAIRVDISNLCCARSAASFLYFFFFSSRRRHTRLTCDWSSDVCSSDLGYALVNGIRMFYAVFGQGVPVLMLHGGLGNSNYWGEVIPILVRNHYEVIVTDSRGHGRSTRTAEPYSYELMASDVLALLDYLRLTKVNLVDWSDGGIIGLAIAMRHPERLRRLFAYGANSDPSGARPDMEGNATWTSYIERTRGEYRQLSPTPQDYDTFLAQIQPIRAQHPNFT